ncbi:hypothetical protein DEO72_LG3g1518 [Vigna unguiculata]|uniref:Uncharacterized protein n=1 Tax=Vigna unguiculata TaxID=3917 RepID=A0A4D6LEI5_VIGUN|nr:hypothetical protein DEO72_LG3g1518 [Vigna unguiculata]
MGSGSTDRRGGGLPLSLPLHRGGEVRIASIYPNNVRFVELVNCETIRPFQGNDEMKAKVMVLLISFRDANVALNIRSVPRLQFILI